MIQAESSRNPNHPLDPARVLQTLTDHVLKPGAVLQFGGKSTVGRGRCRIVGL